MKSKPKCQVACSGSRKQSGYTDMPNDCSAPFGKVLLQMHLNDCKRYLIAFARSTEKVGAIISFCMQVCVCVCLHKHKVKGKEDC